MPLYPRQKIARFRNGWKDDSSFAAFVTACKAAGGRNLIQELLDPFVVRQASNPQPDVGAALAGFRARPWYTAAELARLWPVVCIGLAQKQGVRHSPAHVATALARCGLPKLKQWDGSTLFQRNGKASEYFICQDVHRIAGLRFTQNCFDKEMSK